MTPLHGVAPLAVVFSDDERNALLLATNGFQSRWAYALVGRDLPGGEWFSTEARVFSWCGNTTAAELKEMADRAHVDCPANAGHLAHALDVVGFGAGVRVDATRCAADDGHAVVSVGRVADRLDDAELTRLFGRPWPHEAYGVEVYASPRRRLLLVTRRGTITDVLTTEDGDLTTATALTKTPRPAPNEALALR